MNHRYVSTFRFNHEIESLYCTIASLTAQYDVLFTHNDGENRTHIRVSPDFGPVRWLSIADVGITWKSILHGYNWCRRHADKHLGDWVEMDLSVDVRGTPVLDSGVPVIPVSKLSTPALTTDRV